MKKLYQITYELTDESFREALEFKIKELGRAVQVLDSSWILQSDLTQTQLCGAVANTVKEGLSIIVTELTGKADWIISDIGLDLDEALSKVLRKVV